MNYFEVERSIQIAIDDGRKLEVVSFSLDEDTEEQLRLILEKILAHYNQEHLNDCLFSCIIELATNGTKANMKHVFFDELRMDILDPLQHQIGRRLFKARTRDGQWMKAYAEKAMNRGLYVKIVFVHTGDGLRIEVINNRPLVRDDELRIRQKLALAMEYDSIVDFCRDHGDETEGAGLGFALNLIMMKAEKLDPSLLRIVSDNYVTTARIEVPYNDKFQTVRRRGGPPTAAATT